MIEEWTRVTPRSFTKAFQRPDMYSTMHISAVIRDDKRWHLFIRNVYIADFQTFEELDETVPVLVNAYLRRTE